MGTTDSRHTLPIYPNLSAEIVPTAINQLWVADITYLRWQTEFVYLAVVLDAFSRRVIGWSLGRTLEADLAVTALQRALPERRPQPTRYATLRECELAGERDSCGPQDVIEQNRSA